MSILTRPRPRAAVQGLLFGDDAPELPDDIGYRGPVACAAAGITYRQLDYWARTGLVEPSVRPATGSGTQRLYGFRDILVLKVVKRLLDTGVSLQKIRTAVQHLRDRGVDDLAQITLMSDGASVYECTSAGRGHRPRPGRSGRVRHRRRPGLARGRGRRWPTCPASGRAPNRPRRASTRPTSWPPGDAAPPAESYPRQGRSGVERAQVKRRRCRR